MDAMTEIQQKFCDWLKEERKQGLVAINFTTSNFLDESREEFWSKIQHDSSFADKFCSEMMAIVEAYKEGRCTPLENM